MYTVLTVSAVTVWHCMWLASENHQHKNTVCQESISTHLWLLAAVRHGQIYQLDILILSFFPPLPFHGLAIHRKDKKQNTPLLCKVVLCPDSIVSGSPSGCF